MLHCLHILCCDRKVISRIIFPVVRLADALYIELICALKYRYISVYPHIIHCLKFPDSGGSKLPDFRVHSSCFILQA